MYKAKGYGGTWMKKEIADIFNSHTVDEKTTTGGKAYIAGHNDAMRKLAMALGLVFVEEEKRCME